MIECTCCSESFIRSSHPIVSDIILDKISLDYTETLQAAAGRQAEAALKTAMEKNKGKYLMLVEGSVPLAEDGVYCCIGGRSAVDIVKEAAAGAVAVICWGSCASNGCIQAANPNPTEATPIHKILRRPVINVPGFPPIADVMTNVVTHILVFGYPPELDGQGRPHEFYGRRVHDTCYRRPLHCARDPKEATVKSNFLSVAEPGRTAGKARPISKKNRLPLATAGFQPAFGPATGRSSRRPGRDGLEMYFRRAGRRPRRIRVREAG